jgi:hypothetical protein
LLPKLLCDAFAKTDTAGPYRAYKGDPDKARYREGDKDFNIWKKFVSYTDKDSFYFLQYFEKLDDSTFSWGYHPPETFKILVYFPDSDSFAVSGICERYAFDSYFRADMANNNADPGGVIDVVRSYDYSGEALTLAVRTIITIALELAVALLFGYRAKKQLLIIGVTNIITQTILNILLNVINYSQGPWMCVFSYIWLELLVFAVEAVIYYLTLNKYFTKKTVKKWYAVVYALAANFLSFFAGLGIAHLIPRIF